MVFNKCLNRKALTQQTLESLDEVARNGRQMFKTLHDLQEQRKQHTFKMSELFSKDFDLFQKKIQKCQKKIDKLYKQDQKLRHMLVILEQCVVTDFINMVEREDGKLEPDELIFNHNCKYFVITIQNLRHMLASGHVSIEIQHLSQSKVLFVQPQLSMTLTNLAPIVFEHMHFIIKIQMENTVHQMHSSDIFYHFGFSGIVKLLKIFDAKTVRVSIGRTFESRTLLMKGQNIYLVNSHECGAFLCPVGGKFICALCNQEYHGNEMRTHLQEHQLALKRQEQLQDLETMRVLQSTTKPCPFCKVPISKICVPREECNHVQCQECMKKSKHFHFCFRCLGYRNHAGPIFNDAGDEVMRCSNECMVHNMHPQYTLFPGGEFIITGCCH